MKGSGEVGDKEIANARHTYTTYDFLRHDLPLPAAVR